MNSKIANALQPPFEPVALVLADCKPEGATQFQPGKWGCVMNLLASAAKGRTAAVDKETFGCWNGGQSLGFGNQLQKWPGGVDCFYYFLSIGNDQWERGRDAIERVRPHLRPKAFAEFVHGERLVKTPERVKKWFESLPAIQIERPFVVFKPLSAVVEGERPDLVIFLVDPDRLSALTILANYGRDSIDNVVMPHGAGCQSVALYAYAEARRERPRAVVGLMDLTARDFIERALGRNLMSFSVPWAMFEEMESNVEGSFLEQPFWKELRERAMAAEKSGETGPK